MMKYKIGDVARILGISTDLLRYYEKKGVVKPEKNAHNDYRYYDAWDINFLVDCLWFKNYGFSIEQIADMVRIPGADRLEELFLRKEEELRATIHRCQLLLQRSEEHRADLRKAEEQLGVCDVAESPALLRYLNRTGGEYQRGADEEAMARRWLSVMPFNRRCFVVGGDVRTSSRHQCRWGFSLRQDYAEQLGFEAEDGVECVPAQRCVRTVFKSSGGREGFAPKLLSYAVDYAEEQGLRLCGPVHGVLLASVMEGNKLTGYFEAWLPVEEE